MVHYTKQWVSCDEKMFTSFYYTEVDVRCVSYVRYYNLEKDFKNREYLVSLGIMWICVCYIAVWNMSVYFNTCTSEAKFEEGIQRTR